MKLSYSDTKSIMKQYMSVEPLLQLQAVCFTVFALIMERPNVIVLALFVFKQIRADLHISQVVEQLPKSEMDHVVISPCLRCGDSEECLRLPSFAAIEEIITSCESWLWSTTRFTVAIVICSVDNSNTDVVHLTKEYSCLLWHFLTYGGEIECEVT